MARTSKVELIVSTWRGLNAPRVGAGELRTIQDALREEFGAGGVQSPASIARVLADEGAELKHPEVIEYDAEWRQAQIESEEKEFERVDEFLVDQPLTLTRAEDLIAELERLRRQFESKSDEAALTRLADSAALARRRAQSLAKSGEQSTARLEQIEIAAWLKVWIQTPAIFADWLELRKSSGEFKKKFVSEKGNQSA